ncbi:MAG: putative holin [Leclercia sp.]
MSEPLTIAVGVTSATIGVTFASMFPEATPGVMLCALAGSAMYVLTSDPHQLWKQFLFAVISFVGGVFFSVPMAKILAGVINTALSLVTHPPVSIEVSPNIGALVSASISVAVLLRILAKSKRGKMPGLEEEGQ